MIRLAIGGAAGRMGRALVRAAAGDAAVTVTAAFEHAQSDALGADAGVVAGVGAAGVTIGAEIDGAEFDVLLEFTTPDATLAHAGACRKLRRAMLIGTTGIGAECDAQLQNAARDIALLRASNTSVGVNLCIELAALAAKTLGEEFDIEIVESHHRAKVDAPSGTALSLGHAAAESRGKNLARHGVFAREGQCGARAAGAIGFSAVRGGDIAGEHTVLFLGDGERVEITHKAGDRKIFADGALRAAKWLALQKPGLYSMRDVLRAQKNT